MLLLCGVGVGGGMCRFGGGFLLIGLGSGMVDRILVLMLMRLLVLDLEMVLMLLSRASSC